MPRTILHTPNEVKYPVCGYEYVNPVALKVEPVSGDTIDYTNRDGLRTVPSHAAERIRGAYRSKPDQAPSGAGKIVPFPRTA